MPDALSLQEEREEIQNLPSEALDEVGEILFLKASS